MGDPSIHIWKEVPLNVTVDYPESIVFGSNLVEFTVNHSGRWPSCRWCNRLCNRNRYICYRNNRCHRKVYIEITEEELETLTVTVTGKTVYPFQGTMEVLPPTGPGLLNYYIINDNAGEMAMV
ncbi:MAG: hypothetical protein R2764_09440 [Bacteroidales bacterium]